MALGKDTGKIGVNGGGLLEVKELPSGSFTSVGYLAESELVSEIDIITIHDETGENIAEDEGNEAWMFNTQLMQRGVDEVQFVRDSKGKTYQARYTCKQRDGKFQAWTLGASCTIRRNMNVPFKVGAGNNIPLVIVLAKGSTTGKYWDVSASSTEPSADEHWPTVN